MTELKITLRKEWLWNGIENKFNIEQQNYFFAAITDAFHKIFPEMDISISIGDRNFIGAHDNDMVYKIMSILNLSRDHWINLLFGQNFFVNTTEKRND